MKAVFEKIHQSVDARLSELKRHLGELAMQGDFQKLQAVTEQAKELEQGKELLRQAELCFAGAERRLESLLRTSHTKAPLTILRVTVCWYRFGFNSPDEVIEKRTAADTLQHMFELLAQRCGNQILERAASVIYGDRPVLSRHPSRDWVNPNSGKPYEKRNIGTTGWHIITHSATKQKIELIEAVRYGLGLPPGAIRAEAIARPTPE